MLNSSHHQLQDQREGHRNNKMIPTQLHKGEILSPKKNTVFQLPITREWSPFDLFTLFISAGTIDVIVNNTNQYAAAFLTKRKKWSWPIYLRKSYFAFSLVLSSWEWLKSHQLLTTGTTTVSWGRASEKIVGCQGPDFKIF